MLNEGEIREFLTEACRHYQKTAPAVESSLDDLYERMSEAPEKVSLMELRQVLMLRTDGQWEQPNYAQNRVYKVRHMLGLDTVGMADH